jgi:PQQ-dependent dehydrogenase (s-GDH family)
MNKKGVFVGLVLLFVFTAVTSGALQNPPGRGPAPERFAMRVVTTGLEIPWEVTWGPDNQLWVTERRGKRVTRVNPADGVKSIAVRIPEVHESVGQDGLLGMALHPELLRGTGNDYVYVAFTYDDAPGPTLLRRIAIRRYTYDSRSRALNAPLDILTGLPSHDDHIAGRLIFGPDQKLYVSVGDQGSNFLANRCNLNRAQELPSQKEIAAKDWIKYQGKILRLNLDGSIPADNPIIAGVRSHIYSYGHRNPQGLVFGPDQKFYAAEHGPSSDDEVNLIEAGKNYGWPYVAGFKDDKAYVYANWSASKPEPCSSLMAININNPPASVPKQKESAWNHADFREPLKSFFTVAEGFDFQASPGAGTIAASGLDLYVGGPNGIPGWSKSLLVLGMTRGRVYRLNLSPDGLRVIGDPVEQFQTPNRYRDIAIHPDQRTFYLTTDVQGRTSEPSGRSTNIIGNPGAILEFKYSASGSN